MPMRGARRYNRLVKVASIALVLSAVALGLGVVSLRRDDPKPARAPARMDRIDDLETRVAELSREVAALKAGRPQPTEWDGTGLPLTPPERPANTATEGPEELKAIVDDAVERKTEKVLDKMRIKTNKKPEIDAFASVLDLSKDQRTFTERVVVEGQRELHAILGTPTADGTNLLDQLVEVAARGMAEPGKNSGFGLWLARVLSEKVPGTDETYGTRIETVKSRMRAAFKREWSEAQYQEFESWGVDPTEIQKVPGSPNEALMKRITERARQLGAVLPED